MGISHFERFDDLGLQRLTGPLALRKSPVALGELRPQLFISSGISVSFAPKEYLAK
jgi:hypothetical protein